jgi:CRP/FNR family transcriptional regulator
MSDFENSLAKVMKSFPSLVAMSATNRTLFAQGRGVKAPAGTFLFGVGDLCNSFLLLLDGTVRVYVGSEEGREMSLYRIEPVKTCLLTTSCLMGQTTYPAIGRAESDIHGFVISNSWFDSLLTGSPEFRELVFKDFGNRLSIIIQLTQEVAFNKLDLRLAQFLLTEDLSKITHQKIALELGTVREIVSRLLKQFQDEGLVTLHRNRIQLLDSERLQAR